MLVTLSGIVILVKLLQFKNALFPMLVTLSGIVMLVNAIIKHSLSNAGDTIRNRDAGQAGAIFKCKTFNAGDTIWKNDIC